MVSSITHSQVMPPAYQAVQYSGSPVPVLTIISNVSGTGTTPGEEVTRARPCAVTFGVVAALGTPTKMATQGVVIFRSF